jgi:hypothetical protein
VIQRSHKDSTADHFAIGPRSSSSVTEHLTFSPLVSPNNSPLSCGWLDLVCLQLLRYTLWCEPNRFHHFAVSGLIAQPLIGAISDSSLSKYRRRWWIVASTTLLTVSGLALAFTEPVASGLVSVFKGGLGDWDPERQKMVSHCDWHCQTKLWTLIYGLYVW